MIRGTCFIPIQPNGNGGPVPTARLSCVTSSTERIDQRRNSELAWAAVTRSISYKLASRFAATSLSHASALSNRYKMANAALSELVARAFNRINAR
jgi:hypothetical protein